MNFWRLSALTGLGLLVLTTTPAHAQAWIGQIAGDMAARQAAAQREAACRNGTPATPKEQAHALTTSEAALAAYAQLGPQSSPKALGKIFALKQPGLSWKDETGPAGIPEFLTRLDGRRATLERIAFVVAGDATTARGIWKASWADAPDRTVWYAVDLVGSPGRNMWGGGDYRIWHFSQFSGSEAPPAPAAYCHYDPDQAW
jgi:hypothetical protein